MGKRLGAQYIEATCPQGRQGHLAHGRRAVRAGRAVDVAQL